MIPLSHRNRLRTRRLRILSLGRSFRHLIFLVCASASIDVQAEWVQVVVNEGDGGAWIDGETITNFGAMKRAWLMWQFSPAIKGSSGDAKSAKELREVDCKERRWRTLQSTFYGGPKGAGKVLGQFEAQPWA